MMPSQAQLFLMEKFGGKSSHHDSYIQAILLIRHALGGRGVGGGGRTFPGENDQNTINKNAIKTK